MDVAQLRREAASHENVHELASDVGRGQIDGAGLAYETRQQFDNCLVLKMTPKVLNPRTREQASCRPIYLLRIRG